MDSRLEPMPPKLVPTSRPASAWKTRALPKSAMMTMRSAAHENDNPFGMSAPGMRNPRGGKDQIRDDPEKPQRIVRPHDLFAHEAGKVEVGLTSGGPCRRGNALSPCAEAGEQRRKSSSGSISPGWPAKS